MGRLTLSNGDEDKKIIAFTINKQVKEKLKAVLVRSKDYNLKRKSDWVNEAILMLKENPDYSSIVFSAGGNTEDFILDKIYMNFEQRCCFSEMRSDVVRQYPDIRGPQGAIIRAAILSRIMHKM